ncbi:MAG: serine hydrolase domain-containing protein [Opitutaceae bacterium]
MSQTGLRDQFQPLIDQGQLDAASVGVVQPSGEVRAHFGDAGTGSRAGESAPDDRTIYEIGSVTKVFTCLLLADAVARGHVKLDTPINELLPEDVRLPDDAGAKITLRMLATHTSGLPRIPAGIPPDDYRSRQTGSSRPRKTPSSRAASRPRSSSSYPQTAVPRPRSP